MSKQQTSPGRQALLDIWPLLIPVVPFGLVYGVLVSDGRTSTFWGWLASPLVMGGASQLTLVTLAHEGTALTSALLSAMIVNARHLMYSAAVSPMFRPQPIWFRAVAPFLLVDQVFALTMARSTDGPAYRRRYWLVLGVTFWFTWVIMTTAGVVFGGAVPGSWRIEFTVLILFLSIVFNALDTPPSIIAAATGFGVAAAAGPLPNRLGLMVGALVGVGAGTIAEVRRR